MIVKIHYSNLGMGYIMKRNKTDCAYTRPLVKMLKKTFVISLFIMMIVAVSCDKHGISKGHTLNELEPRWFDYTRVDKYPDIDISFAIEYLW